MKQCHRQLLTVADLVPRQKPVRHCFRSYPRNSRIRPATGSNSAFVSVRRVTDTPPEVMWPFCLVSVEVSAVGCATF